jgi:hypothetical protein
MLAMQTLQSKVSVGISTSGLGFDLQSTEHKNSSHWPFLGGGQVKMAYHCDRQNQYHNVEKEIREFQAEP